VPLRARALLAAGALAAAGCTDDAASACPGAPVGNFSFTVSHPGGAGPFCARLPGEGTTVVGTFQGTLSQDLSLGTAALCLPGRLAEPYFGRVEAGTYTLGSVGGLAVLGVCGPNCSTLATLGVEGTLDGSGAFVGVFTEAFAYSSGDCGTCALPCLAEYELRGVQ
jgi:hypothetical protein